MSASASSATTEPSKSSGISLLDVKVENVDPPISSGPVASVALGTVVQMCKKWNIPNCPLQDECSATAWGKTKKCVSYESEEDCRLSLWQHLASSGKHYGKKHDIEAIVAQTVVEMSEVPKWWSDEIPKSPEPSKKKLRSEEPVVPKPKPPALPQPPALKPQWGAAAEPKGVAQPCTPRDAFLREGPITAAFRPVPTVVEKPSTPSAIVASSLAKISGTVPAVIAALKPLPFKYPPPPAPLPPQAAPLLSKTASSLKASTVMPAPPVPSPPPLPVPAPPSLPASSSSTTLEGSQLIRSHALLREAAHSIDKARRATSKAIGILDAAKAAFTEEDNILKLQSAEIHKILQAHTAIVD